MKNEKPKIFTLPPVSSEISLLLKYSTFIAITILFGIILKSIYPIEPDYFGKWSIITGIPILRRFQLFEIYSINIIFLLVVIYNIYQQSKHFSDSNNFFMSILGASKLNFTYIFKNFLPILIFSLVFKSIRRLVYHNTDFRISGHYMITMLSVFVLCNIKLSYHYLRYHGLHTTTLNILNLFLNLLFLHHLYVLVFTCWIYHTIGETLVGFLSAFVFNTICHFIEIDILLSEFLKEYDPFSEVEKKIFSEQEENGEYYLIEEIE